MANMTAASTTASPLTQAFRLGATPLLFAGLFSLVTNLLYLALPLYTIQVFTRVLSSQSQATLAVLTFGALAVFVVYGVIEHFRQKVLLNYGIVFDQRTAAATFGVLFDAVVRGDAPARSQVLRDLDSIRQALIGPAVGVLFDLPWIPIFLAALFIVDPLVGVFTGIGGVVLLGLAILQDRNTRPAFKEAADAGLQSYAFTDTALRNAEVVRALGMLPSLQHQWAGFRATTIELGARASEQGSVYANAIRMVRMAMQILIVGLGAYLVLRGAIGPGVMFANMILSARALAPIERAVGSWQALQGAQQAYERLKKVMVLYEPPAPVTQLPRPEGRLSVEGVSYVARGSGAVLLNGVAFHLEPGEAVGVVGPSGAGKSTLTRLLVGVWKPHSGVVRLDGADVFRWDRESFGRHVGYLPQDIELFAGTVRDNIARFRVDVSDEEVISAAQLAGAHEMILRFPKGYETEVGEGGLALSVGQRQRVGLARALLGEPSLVVLDEPNAALDTEGEGALMNALEVLKARKATVVIVSHRVNVFRTVDKMLVMRGGRVDLFGPRDQVMARLAPQPAPAIAQPPAPAAEAKG